jgi:hypothetical protein
MFIIILLVILSIFQVLTSRTEVQIIEPKEQMQNTSNAVIETKNNYDNLSTGPVMLEDPINDDYRIRQYDFNKIYNIFEEPARRVPRDQLPPIHVKRLIDYPSRGLPDNFTQFGILKKKSHFTTGEDHNRDITQTNNFIIRLFGRQEFPGSSRYEYYTMVNNGLDQIKIPIYNRNRELYDEDEIFIKELESKYIVSLYHYDNPRYYPDIIY